MNLITKFFGAKPPSAATVAGRIAVIEAERAAALTQQAAATARLADVALLSAEEHAATETAQAEGRRAAERADARIKLLRAEQAVAEAREVREAFDRDVAAHERAVTAWHASVEQNYPDIARTLADMLAAREAIGQQARKLEQRARTRRPLPRARARGVSRRSADVEGARPHPRGQALRW